MSAFGILFLWICLAGSWSCLSTSAHRTHSSLPSLRLAAASRATPRSLVRPSGAPTQPSAGLRCCLVAASQPTEVVLSSPQSRQSPCGVVHEWAQHGGLLFSSSWPRGKAEEPFLFFPPAPARRNRPDLSALSALPTQDLSALSTLPSQDLAALSTLPTQD